MRNEHMIEPQNPQCVQMSVSGSVILPNQLRVGNTIECFIETDNLGWQKTKVDWQHIKWCSEQNESFNVFHRKIKITEEILKENSFEFCYGKDWNFNPNVNWRFPVKFSKHPDNKVKGLCCFLNGFFYLKIEYLNELENLFHFLTASELTDR